MKNIKKLNIKYISGIKILAFLKSINNSINIISVIIICITNNIINILHLLLKYIIYINIEINVINVYI